MKAKNEQSGDMLAHLFFDAISLGDSALVSSLVTPDCVIWHNYDGTEKPFSEMIPKLAAFRGMLAELAYAERDYMSLADGTLALHILHSVRPDGIVVDVPVAVRLRCSDGLINHIMEYVDPAALAPLASPQGASSQS